MKSTRTFSNPKRDEAKKFVVARVAIDKTVLKYNGIKCCLLTAVGVERKKIIYLKVYLARNDLTVYSFLKEVLRMCEVEELILDKELWYRDALHPLGVGFRHETFGERSLVESVFSSFRQRARIFLLLGNG